MAPTTARSSLNSSPGYARIATEEAFAPPELINTWVQLLHEGNHPDIGFTSLHGHYMTSESPRPRWVRGHLMDLGQARLAHMDQAGITHQVLAVTAPGAQNLPPAQATALCRTINDFAASASQECPERFSALAAVNFLDSDAAVAELRRAINELGFKGLILNSHISGRYVTEERFFPILAEAEKQGVPLYLHPSTPPNDMIRPFREAGLDGAIFGFGVEAGLHLLKIITSGVLDKFPNLKVVAGHLGEALPFWLNRIDYFHATQVKSQRYDAIQPLRQRPSEYFQSNIWVTTSGMPWEKEIMFVRDVIGKDRVMYAMDYPYQYDAAEVTAQDNLPMNDTDKKMFFEDTARKVFNLDF